MSLQLSHCSLTPILWESAVPGHQAHMGLLDWSVACPFQGTRGNSGGTGENSAVFTGQNPPSKLFTMTHGGRL